MKQVQISLAVLAVLLLGVPVQAAVPDPVEPVIVAAAEAVQAKTDGAKADVPDKAAPVKETPKDSADKASKEPTQEETAPNEEEAAPLGTASRAASFVAIPVLSKEANPPEPKTEDKKIEDTEKASKAEGDKGPKDVKEPKAEAKIETPAPKEPASKEEEIVAPEELPAQIRKLGQPMVPTSKIPSEPKAVEAAPAAAEPVVEAQPTEPVMPVLQEPKESSVDVMPTDKTPTAVTKRKAPLRDSRQKRIIVGGNVDRAPIEEISKDSFGVLSDGNGGLGAAMWKGTSRRMIDRVLPALDLPVPSPVLNDLARRFLLTTAAVPDDRQTEIKPLPDFTSMRVDKLLALGTVDEAWQLANMVKEGQLDEITLRRLTHAALLRKKDEGICPLIPDLIAAYSKRGRTASEWQKTLIFCQMKAENKPAVELGLDLLREQKIKDDPFMQLVGHNYLKKWKKLPKNMTPLRSIDLAVLRFLGKTLPKDFYKRTEAVNLPALLAGPAASSKAKLQLAEKEARRGQITTAQLISVYDQIKFKSKEFAKPLMTKRKGAYARALFYQTAKKQKEVSARLQIVMKFLSTVSDRDLAGTIGLVLADLAEGIPVSEEYGIFAAQGARLYALAGDPDRAMKWRTLAKRLAVNFAEVGVQLAARWPVFVFSGLESDGDYAQGMADWLFVSLVPGTPTQERERRDYAGKVLLLLAAAGYAVPEEAWLRVTEAPPLKKGVITSPLLLERLDFVSKAERKGETVLLSLLLAGSEGQDTSLSAQIGVVRALRLAGLEMEAKLLAREAVASMKIP